MKAFVLKYDCDSYDFSCSTNLKVFLIEERAKETKSNIENLFFHYADALSERLASRDILIQKEKKSGKATQASYDEINKMYASDATKLFNEFIEQSEFKDVFKKEHLALKEEYSFEVEEVDFEGE